MYGEFSDAYYADEREVSTVPYCIITLQNLQDKILPI
jgi:hypothetical protein